MTTTANAAHTDTPAITESRTSTLRRLVAAVHTFANSQRARFSFVLAVLIAGATGLSANGRPCNCAITPTDAPMVEWSIPSPADFSSGAITVDVHNSHKARLWFVSRIGDVKLFRFEPGSRLASDDAKWKWFQLQTEPPSTTTGGLHGNRYRIKVHKNDQVMFVRTHTSLQRIDSSKCTGVASLDPLLNTETCERTTWLDQVSDLGPDVIPHVSDLSLDDCHVYTTTAVFADATAELPIPAASYLQQLTPCLVNNYDPALKKGTTTVKRWQVGGSAGFCPTSIDSSPCISGVVVDPKSDNLVWFSQPGDSKIGQLNVNDGTVKRWSLSVLGTAVREPRQLEFDDDGTLWAVTGSGHLVHLDWKRNRMSAHQMPPSVDPNGPDPFGVAADHGAIGYTRSSQGDSRIGMLLPKGNMVPAYPVSTCLTASTVPLTFVKDDAPTMPGKSTPEPKMTQAHTTIKNDGTFVEAAVGGEDSGNDSFRPLGVTPDFSRRVGSYFYAVGMAGTATNRLGHIILPFDRKGHGHGRDEDDNDCDDNDGHHHQHDADDHDNDGVKDGDDDHGKKERRDQRQDDVNGGQSVDYPMEANSSNVAFVTTATAADPGTMLSIEVRNPAGQLVAAPLPAPGVAVATVPTLTPGIYTVRVKNLGITPTTFTTNSLTRSVWTVLPDLP